jgi:hypothetical protein
MDIRRPKARPWRAGVVLLVLGVAAVVGTSAATAAPITLTTISTGFNNPVGIDHHEPTNRLALSVNYPTGNPRNFELVAADGTRTPFSNLSGLTDEVKIATVRSGPCQGGFTPGELFTGNGQPGQIVRISPTGASAQNPWVTLPGEPGLMRGSLFQDRYCAFGGDLIVVTTAGNVWRVTSAGAPTKLASLATHLEGVTTLPDDVAQYGPWAGKIVAGAEGQGRIYTIAPGGATQFFALGINPEDFDVIPENQNFYGVNFGGARLMGADAAQFCDVVDDVLVTQESGILWRVHWNGQAFEKENVAQVEQWEHVTFSPASVQEIPPAPAFSIDDVTVTEGDSGTVDATFTVSLTGSQICPKPVSVDFQTADGTATAPADYASRSGTLTFAPGETSKTITVPVNGDTIDEPDEQFFVDLSNASNAAIADGRGIGTILDDDRDGNFSCRASALRIGALEPVVANPADEPCKDDSKTLLNLAVGPVTAGVAKASTDQTPDNLQGTPPAVGDNGAAHAELANVGISLGVNLVTVEALSADAKARCTGSGPPALSGSSRVVLVGPTGPTVITQPTTIPLVLATLRLNQTTTASGRVTQRALVLDPLVGPDVVVGEATADFRGNPCPQ